MLTLLDFGIIALALISNLVEYLLKKFIFGAAYK